MAVLGGRRERLRRSLHNQLTIATTAGDLRFAPYNELADIWTDDVIRRFAGYERIRIPSPFTVDDLRRDFLQTLSILLYMHWDDWPHFDTLFLLHRGPDQRLDRTDRHIQDYDVQALTSHNFLGPIAGNGFYNHRQLFCPVNIIENDDLVKESGWKLPFLYGKSELCGSGGFGRVKKEVIAARHYRSDDVISDTEKSVARKIFKSTTDFYRERNNLQKLGSCDSQNKRIVLPLATIVVGDQPNILFPLAKMDLDKFLAGGHLSPEACDMGDLLRELMGLAGALAHIHDGLGFNTRGCHADLKCANILVYPTHDAAWDFEIGRWMITDFGLSIITPIVSARRGSGDTIPEPQGTKTVTLLRQMPGPYHAPEVRRGSGVSRSSDVWSLGCIMVRVLSFKLDGVQGLKELDRLRGKEDDGTTQHRNDWFTRGDQAILNPHISRWISGLPTRYPGYSEEFLQQCANVLRDTLAFDKHDRPKADDVVELLGNLRSSYHTTLKRPINTPAQSDSSIGSVRTSNSSEPEIPSPPSPGGILPLDALFDAIKTADSSMLEACLAASVDIEQRDSQGDTPLGLAAKSGDATIVQLLLDAKAPVNARSANGKTALMLASSHGHEAIVKLLLDSEADCFAYSDEGLTCLHYATGSDAGVGLIRLLTPHFETVEIPARDPTGDTPLVSLVKKFVDDEMWEAKLLALVVTGADVNAKDRWGNRPIDYARLDKSRRAVELLEKHTSVASPSLHRTSTESSRSLRSLARPWLRPKIK
ncbi:hypothetical protein BJX64DRAFT_297730 [Aspergillus heterothallicus]